jgi:two-component system sensor histidine kinase BaeS
VALLARAERQFRGRAEAAGVILRVDAPARLPAVQGDAQRLGQVLANLVSNALRYTPRGGQVILSARAEGRWLLLTVADTGTGIAPADLPLVFERFYRADRSRRRDAGHSGLGLAIARQLVEAHGGALTATSQVGVGSTFTARLPLAG